MSACAPVSFLALGPLSYWWGNPRDGHEKPPATGEGPEAHTRPSGLGALLDYDDDPGGAHGRQCTPLPSLSGNWRAD